VGSFDNGVATFGLHRVYILSCPRTPQTNAGLLCDEAVGPTKVQQTVALVTGWCWHWPDRSCGVRGAQWWPWETSGTGTPPSVSTVIHCRNV